MADLKELIEKKARLISAGELYVTPGTKLPYYPSKSTAGPDAGRTSITLALDSAKKVRIKLALTDDPDVPFKLISLPAEDGDKAEPPNFEIQYKDKTYLLDVTPVPTLLHAPNQAFINLTPDCKYNCLFCASPRLGDNAKVKARNLDEWVEIILKASRRPGFLSVALTSGVPESPGKTVSDLVYVISKVKEVLPEVPIGVEPCIDDLEDIEKLHRAGATELKLNIQTYESELFEKICPGLERDFILKALEFGVKVFGPNKVCSNLIIGLGETDESVRDGIEHLARLGVVVNLRVLRLNDYNRPKLAEALSGGAPSPVTPERLMELVRFQQETFDNYELSSREFETMCHRCGACDLDLELESESR
jgi:biotin synthase-related radical SAM superfamily protein